VGRVAASAQNDAPAKADKATDLLRGFRSDIVLIKGKAGSGSGFVVNLKDRKFLASNAHVMAAVKSPTFSPLDRSLLRLKPGAASVAVGHDVILLEVLQGGRGMPLIESFETEVAVNDPIVVYGNTRGGDVVTAINDFNRWPAWSPWEELDTEMERTLSGETSGKGAIYEWKGNKKVGRGRMEITESVPPEKISIQLDFFEPWKAHNTTDFTFASSGDGTDVVWSMNGTNPFMMKVICLFMDMDKMVGKDFEKGLDKLSREVATN
jgi:hypothetical protein